ncbi:MAG: hypothetical protein Q4B73_10295, partial [Lachnospiraceae bacterium]|nr:hypothetical protein [Lachnospiraceae bacterium]
LTLLEANFCFQQGHFVLGDKRKYTAEAVFWGSAGSSEILASPKGKTILQIWAPAVPAAR